MDGGSVSTHSGVRWVSIDTVEVDLFGASNRDHIDALAEVDRVRRQADAAQIDVVASALARAVHCDDGHRNLQSWVCATLNTSRRSASQWVRRAVLGDECPDYLEALRQGGLGLDHYDEIVRVHANPRVRRHLAGFAEKWVTVAATRTFDEFAEALAVWANLIDQDGNDPTDAAPRRGLSVTNSKDGSVKLSGFYDAEAGTVLRDILGQFLAQENRIDHDAAAADLAAGGLGVSPRTISERRADALLAAMTQSLATPPGAPAKPLTTLVLGWHAAQQLLAGFDPTAPVSTIDQLCRGFDGEPLDVRAVLAALIEGRVQVLVADAMGNPFALGRPGSLFTAKERTGLHTLHPRCEWRGCTARGADLQADHMQARSRGGPTAMSNAAWLCGFHNRWRFSHDYHLWRDPHGQVQITRPDGTPLHPATA